MPPRRQEAKHLLSALEQDKSFLRFKVKVQPVRAWLDIDFQFGTLVIFGGQGLPSLILGSARLARDRPAGLLVPVDLDAVLTWIRPMFIVQVVIPVLDYAGSAYLGCISLFGDESDASIIHRLTVVTNRTMHTAAIRTRRAAPTDQGSDGDRQQERAGKGTAKPHDRLLLT